MAEPPQRRKPATELEVEISAGDVSAVGPLVDLLDEPLHRHLVAKYRRLLSEQDREDIIAEFIADLVETPQKYDVRRASIEHFAKGCVENKAIDLLRKRDTQAQYELGPGTSAVLRLTSEDPECDLDFEIQVERARIAAATMDPKYHAALDAFWRFGKQGYKQALMNEYGITGETAATWLTRAKNKLEEAMGLAIRLDP